MAEVEEYAGVLARKKRLAEDLVLLAVSALPLTVVGRAAYAAAIPEAKKRIGQRDPDDIELLALALYFNVPVWSNDKDFEGTGVPWLTTERFLRQLGQTDAL
jgi:predicted nucleic acid-binding protein